jgi:hypothetical protein
MEASSSFGKRRIAATVTTQDGEVLRWEGMVMWMDGEIATPLCTNEGGGACQRMVG